MIHVSFYQGFRSDRIKMRKTTRVLTAKELERIYKRYSNSNVQMAHTKLVDQQHSSTSKPSSQTDQNPRPPQILSQKKYNIN